MKFKKKSLTRASSVDFIDNMPAVCLTSHHIFLKLAFSYTFKMRSLSFTGCSLFVFGISQSIPLFKQN